MFIELMPLIESRPLTITVAALGDGRIRVNVVPRAVGQDGKANEKIGYSNKEKVAQIPEAAILALTTPLSLSGTPEEIDAELAQQLTAFVDSHHTLQRSVDEAKQQIAEAVRAIEERDRSRTKVRTTRVTKALDTKSEKSSENKEEEAKSAPDNLSLFDAKESKTSAF